MLLKRLPAKLSTHRVSYSTFLFSKKIFLHFPRISLIVIIMFYNYGYLVNFCQVNEFILKSLVSLFL